MKFSLRVAITRLSLLAKLVLAHSALILLALLSHGAAYAQSNTSTTVAAPTLIASLANSTTVELSWSPVSDAVGYELWVWWPTGPGWQPIGGSALTGTTHTHSNLTAGRTYSYAVAALDSEGTRGAWSETVSVFLPALSPPPAAPELTATPVGSTAIVVNWNAVTGAVTYDLRTWWDSDTGWLPLGDGSLTSTTFNHSDLVSGRTYYYIIAATDAGGARSDWSAQVNETLPASSAPLPAPTLSATSNVTSTVELRWTEIVGASSYELWEWKDAVTDWQQLNDGNLTETSHTRIGATAGQTYLYAVAAVDTKGTRGAWSQVVSVLVSETPANPDHSAERATLIAFYQATGGENWSQNDNWLSNASIATWYGVKTNEEGRVEELTLAGNRLSGSLPNISALTHLTVLDLDFNQLTGSVPDLSALTELAWLSVSSNQLTGSVPDLAPLSKLEVLDLSFNQLTGSIPDLNSLSQISDLSLANNNLTGSIPTLSALTNLTALHLGANQLTGSIPDLSALSDLTVLSLSGNQLSGSIPEVRTLTNLTDLYLGSNQLTGSVPILSALTKLAWIDLSNNQLTGPLPDVSTLVNLRLMLLPNNQLSGPIPNLATLTTLTDLSLANNLISGTIPEIGSLANLNWLDLSNNQLSGQIPDLASLTNLSRLNLGRNQVTGSIPTLAALTRLTALDLGSNQLTGSIPDMSTLTNLTSLILASNQLTGPVPDLSALTHLSSIDLSANQLCLSDDIDPADANAVVSAHLVGLNLPSCTVSSVSGPASG